MNNSKFNDLFLVIVFNLIIVASLSILSGCGDNSETQVPIEVVATLDPDNSVELTADEIFTSDDFSCYSTVGVSANEFTHWSNYPQHESWEAEVLALESSLEFTADSERYSQIVNDLAAIRTSFIEDTLTLETAMPCTVLSKIIVGLDQQAAESFRSGNYDAMQEFNEKYGASFSDEVNSMGIVYLDFKRNYYMPTLVDLYAQQSFEGVEYLEPDTYFGGDSDICREDLADASRVYIFLNGSGDCSAGCTQKRYSGYKVDADNVIEHLGLYLPGEDEPEWYQQRRICRAFL